jgi:integrase
VLRCERQWVAGKGGQRLEDLKSDSGSVDGVRSIPFAPDCVELIERYREHLKIEVEREPEGWLLSYDGGVTPLRAKALGERISRLAKKLGIPATAHSFRRTADTQLVAANVDVDTASRRQGHTKEVMLRHYVLGADDRASAAAHALEARLIDQGLDIPELLA